ncbi:mechanosensitive ion channel family protein [Salirhabdus salicampi]|uniref:mechanosensitive ion channel family protein n=1 Tax=Salirhabdus salicampi TaxID=476102 RepID=UPI0020C24229|nr:mechanosensitive ion channel family protein [Salirhabdus salicampi]MCP8616039.1 mechanosensitive ion channel family protein [Salirhabdus salicampi]
MEFFANLNIDFDSLIQQFFAVSLKIILILIAYAIAKPLGRKIITTSMTKMTEQQKLSEGRAKTLEKLMLSTYSYVLFFMMIVTVLSILQIPIGPLLAGAGILGLAIGFGAQGLVSDVVTGFFILLERQIDVDDYISVAGLSGIVEEIGLKTLKLRDFDGTLHYIPNRDISNVSNHSRGTMRALVDIGIAYGENIDEAVKVLKRVCEEFAASDERIEEGPDVLGVQSLGSSDVVIRVIAKTVSMEQWSVERALRQKLKEALDQAGIEIPFPHRVLIQQKSESK